MRRLTSWIIAAVMGLGFATTGLAQDWVGTWKNESGSYLDIQNENKLLGLVSGVYVNNASGFSCKGTPYPVIGRVIDNQIAFTVRWSNGFENCNSLTSWTGYFDTGIKQILTKWNLVYVDSRGNNQTSSGKNQFKKINAKKSILFEGELPTR